MQCMSAPFPMSSCILTGHSTSRNQRESPLLRLPPELCDKTYRYALGGYKIRVCCKVRRRDWYPELNQPPHNFTALTRVSRQVHFEIVNLCATLNTFSSDLTTWNLIFRSSHQSVVKNASANEVVLYEHDVFLEEIGLCPEVRETGRHLRELPNLKSVVVSWRPQVNAGAVNKKTVLDLVQDAFRLPSHVDLQVFTFKDIEKRGT